MSQPRLPLRIVNLSLSIFPLYLRIVKGPSGLYGYTFGWGCYPLYLQHKKFTLVPILNFHQRGIDYIYKKKDLWENNDLIRSHELFQYISQMLLILFHFRCLYIYERVFRQVYSCRYGSNIEIQYIPQYIMCTLQYPPLFFLCQPQ